MKLIINQNEDNIILNVDGIKENLSFNEQLNTVQYELALMKFNLQSKETMYDYCKNLFNITIKNIYCYDDDNILKFIYKKYGSIKECKTYSFYSKLNDIQKNGIIILNRW